MAAATKATTMTIATVKTASGFSFHRLHSQVGFKEKNTPFAPSLLIANLNTSVANCRRDGICHLDNDGGGDESDYHGNSNTVKTVASPSSTDRQVCFKEKNAPFPPIAHRQPWTCAPASLIDNGMP